VDNLIPSVLQQNTPLKMRDEAKIAPSNNNQPRSRLVLNNKLDKCLDKKTILQNFSLQSSGHLGFERATTDVLISLHGRAKGASQMEQVTLLDSCSKGLGKLMLEEIELYSPQSKRSMEDGVGNPLSRHHSNPKQTSERPSTGGDSGSGSCMDRRHQLRPRPWSEGSTDSRSKSTTVLINQAAKLKDSSPSGVSTGEPLQSPFGAHANPRRPAAAPVMAWSQGEKKAGFQQLGPLNDIKYELDSTKSSSQRAKNQEAELRKQIKAAGKRAKQLQREQNKIIKDAMKKKKQQENGTVLPVMRFEDDPRTNLL